MVQLAAGPWLNKEGKGERKERQSAAAIDRLPSPLIKRSIETNTVAEYAFTLNLTSSHAHGDSDTLQRDSQCDHVRHLLSFNAFLCSFLHHSLTRHPFLSFFSEALWLIAKPCFLFGSKPCPQARKTTLKLFFFFFLLFNHHQRSHLTSFNA